MCVCLCVCLCVCVCARVCVHVCDCVCACVCVCACLSVIISLYRWGYLFICTLIRYLGFMEGGRAPLGGGGGVCVFFTAWMFQHDCLDTCFLECLICMCFVFLYLHLLSAFEHVSHGKVLKKYAHYYYYYYINKDSWE